MFYGRMPAQNRATEGYMPRVWMTIVVICQLRSELPVRANHSFNEASAASGLCCL